MYIKMIENGNELQKREKFAHFLQFVAIFMSFGSEISFSM